MRKMLLIISAFLALSLTLSAQERVSSSVLVIPVEFSDVKFENKNVKSILTDIFIGTNHPESSVSDYLRDNLSALYDFEFQIIDVVTLSNPMSYYGGNSEGADTNLKAFVQDATFIADTLGVDFSIYDSDSDGVVDNIFLIYAGYSEAEGGPEDAIWSHYWNLLQENIEYDRVKIGDYCAVAFYAGNEGGKIVPIGSICHEFLHSLGLPDMYDANGDVEGLSHGLWHTSIMDRGLRNNNGNTPPYLNAVERELLGFLEVEELQVGNSYEIHPINISNKAYRISTNNENEYFLIEMRRSVGWDAFLPDQGMIVYHIDKSDNIAGSMSAAQRWQFNAVNCAAEHNCVDILEANGDSITNPADIFYPGLMNIDRISNLSPSPLISWAGDGPEIAIDNISWSSNGHYITFDVVSNSEWTKPHITNFNILPFQNDAIIEWDYEVIPKMRETVLWRVDCVDMLTQEVIFSQEVNEPTLKVDNLQPASQYEVVIYYIDQEAYELERYEFVTMSISNSYPKIYLTENQYFVGDKLYLRLFNNSEELLSVTWKVNNKVCNDDYYIFKELGDYEITVNIKYSDRSIESITRVLSVGIKEEVKDE